MGVPSRRHLWFEIQMAQIRGMIMGGTWSHFGCCLPGVIGNRAVQALPNESCQQLFDVFSCFSLSFTWSDLWLCNAMRNVRIVFTKRAGNELVCIGVFHVYPQLNTTSFCSGTSFDPCMHWLPGACKSHKQVDPYMAYYACMHVVYYYIFLWLFFNIFHYFQLTAVFTFLPWSCLKNRAVWPRSFFQLVTGDFFVGVWNRERHLTNPPLKSCRNL